MENSDQFRSNGHFVPRFYLVGFSDSGKRHGKVWQFDAEGGSPTPNSAKAIGKETDYHTVTIAGKRSDAPERLFGKIETNASEIVVEVAKRRRIPTSMSKLRPFMYFVALSYFRGPAYRNLMAEFMAEKETKSIRIALMNPELWAQYVTACQKAGKSYPHGSFTMLSNFFRRDGGKLRVSNSNEMHTKSVLESLHLILDKLYWRDWGIEYVDNPANDYFITSDSPVTISRIGSASIGHEFCGLDTPSSEVIFPLDKRTALVGRYERMPRSAEVDVARVAEINSRTAGLAARYVYGPKDDFVFSDPHGNQLTASDWHKARAVTPIASNPTS